MGEGIMPSVTSEALTLIRAALAHLEEYPFTPVLASVEECDYFRKQYTPLVEKKAPLPKPIVKEPATPPIPALPAPEVKIVTRAARLESGPSRPDGEELAAPCRSGGIPSFQEGVLHAAPPIKPVTPVEKAQWQSAPQFSSAPENFEEMRKIWKKIAPSAPILEEIPGDETAKKIATRWKTNNQTAPISILSFSEPPEQRALLEQIAKAIGIVFGSARIVQAETIEKEKQWESFLSVPHLKYVIACDYSLWQLTGLMQHYREAPGQGVRLLGAVPLFLLPDLSLYLKDPLLKRSLWKALCQKLPSS